MIAAAEEATAAVATHRTWSSRASGITGSWKWPRSRPLDWRILPPEPTAEAVQARIEHALCDIRLIEFVAHFPLERSWNHHATSETGMGFLPFGQRCRRAGHQGKEGE